jgi:SAM-dependent methyltransferase
MPEGTRVSAERFERLYAASPDPWDYTGSEYEREKYVATLAAIGPGTYGRVLEIGCSIGVFTELLAPRCERLVAVDFSASAIELARRRVGRLANVELVQASFPEDVHEGPWRTIVCSEVLYYLDRPTLESALRWLAGQLSDGASVVVVSWRGPGKTEPLRGDDVHDLLQERFARWHVLDARRLRYRLDRFDGSAPATPIASP